MDASGPLVDPKQLVIQFGVFTASYLVLKNILFKPYLDLLHARRERSSALKEKTAEAKVKTEALQADYNRFVHEEKKKVATWLDTEKKLVNDDERKTIEVARNQVSEKLSSLRKEVEAQVETARGQLNSQVGDYSSRIVSKLVGKKVAASATTSGGGTKNAEADSAV